MDGFWKRAEQKDIVISVEDLRERAWGCVLNEEDQQV
jgi:hypothetical protein